MAEVCSRRLEQRCGNSEDRIAWYLSCARPDHGDLVERLARAAADAIYWTANVTKVRRTCATDAASDFIMSDFRPKVQKVLKQCANATANIVKFLNFHRAACNADAL